MKVLYLNISEGCKEQDRFNKIVEFVKSQDPDVIGLSELNGWDQNNFEKLKLFQKQTGYNEVIFCKAKTGYHLGLFSKKKFSTASAINEGFWHGLIIAKINVGGQDTTLMLTHLCPTNEDLRLKEIENIQKQFNDGDKVILFGDLNSLSTQDKYEESFILEKMKKLKIIKFGENELRKDIITRIVDLGFVDAVRKFSEDFEYSVPTPISRDKDHITKLRLDYIFVKNSSSNLTNARIIRNKETDQLSDHYPVVAEFGFWIN